MRSTVDLDSLTDKQLEKLLEDPVRTQVVIPLLKDIGAQRIIDMHGSREEEGIDVYFEWPDIFDHTRRFGIQVKADELGYTREPNENKNILVIMNQIEMAFNRDIPLPFSKDGKTTVKIDGFYLINSRRMKETAKNFICKQRERYPYIHVVDGQELMTIVRDRHRLRQRAMSMGISGPFL